MRLSCILCTVYNIWVIHQLPGTFKSSIAIDHLVCTSTYKLNTVLPSIPSSSSYYTILKSSIPKYSKLPIVHCLHSQLSFNAA